MVVRESRRLCTLRCPQVIRLLVWATCSHGSIANALASLVGRMVEQSSNVVNEKRVEELCDLLLVREVQRAVKRNPVRMLALAQLKQDTQ